MPASSRPTKGSGGAGSRAPPVTPMSERQQMALLMQMTSTNNEVGARSPNNSSSSGGGGGTSSSTALATRSRDRNERGETPLHLAAIKGDVEQVCKLLAHRADPNVADFAGWTPLHEACNHGWYEVAYRLVQSGANVNAKGLDNDTPLHDAASNGHLKLIKLLVERGADIHAKNSKGKTPLDVAATIATPFLLNPSLPLPESTVSTRLQPRSRDDKKITDNSKKITTPSSSTPDSRMDGAKASNPPEDVYEFKTVKESDKSPEPKPSDVGMDQDATDTASTTPPDEPNQAKRNFSEISMTDAPGETPTADEESRRKKRKEETSKDKTAKPNQTKGPGKQVGNQTKSESVGASIAKTTDKKSPCASPKPTSDVELEDGKSDLKVPPLKIVIPQSSAEQETGASRNGKSSSQRTHQALPYVVASSNSNDSNDKEMSGSGSGSPEAAKTDEKKDGDAGAPTDDQRGSSSSHQRVLRSSHRTGTIQGGTDRGSNNSSPQLQRSHSPSPSASPSAASNPADAPASNSSSSSSNSTSVKPETQTAPNTIETKPCTSTLASTSTPAPAPVELHPRKRKMKPKEASIPEVEPDEKPAETQVHPHEQPITNCYQLYLNIRKQIEARRKRLFFRVQPRPPVNFNDYMSIKCEYFLASSPPNKPIITYPSDLPAQLKDLFTKQEEERYKLKMQHVVETEKLGICVEQEILRVHGRASRAVANQSHPLSVCTILRDEEVYNFITPEEDEKEKDRNARSRHNGRMFMSWLQDLDDKWDKIKEPMLARHQAEAESLNAIQKLNWEWKMKELSLCDRKTTPKIDETHVPMVEVLDDVRKFGEGGLKRR